MAASLKWKNSPTAAVSSRFPFVECPAKIKKNPHSYILFTNNLCFPPAVASAPPFGIFVRDTLQPLQDSLGPILPAMVLLLLVST
jgi:hypothetical protein